MQANANHDHILEFLLESLKDFQKREDISEGLALHGDVPLIGDGGIIDSRSLVELLIALEEFIEERYSAEFDWTSDRAMSAKRSPFRTPRTLAEFAVTEAGL
jgi:hypothetical protein